MMPNDFFCWSSIAALVGIHDMKRHILCVFLAMLVSQLCAETPLKVRIITGGHDFEKEAFLKVFEANKEINFTHVEHGKDSATAYDREDLEEQDCVVLYDMAKTITAAQKAKLLSFLSKGKGLVVMHHAIASYPQWPEYERIMGGKYLEVADATHPASTYEHDVQVPVIVVAKDHPITAGISDFTIHDEIYGGFRVSADVTPLLSTTHPKSGKPLVWIREEDRARVVYIQLGHDHLAYENPNFQRLVKQSIRWSARK